MTRRLAKKFIGSRMGQLYQDPECDKYTFKHGAEVDYQIKRHIYKVLCCKFPSALSWQDVEEGVIE